MPGGSLAALVTPLVESLRLVPEDVTNVAMGAVPGWDVHQSHEDFLGLGAAAAPVLLVKPRGLATTFNQVAIKFMPKAETPEEQTLACENDLAVCNRKCEEIFGDRTAEMEEPCKLAVAKQFGMGGRTMCFPSHARVIELNLGNIPISELQVGDMVMVEGGEFSRVVALLHENRTNVGLYLRVKHDSGYLDVSPEHLVRALQQGAFVDASSEGSWVPAENLRAGDFLVDADGRWVQITGVSRICLCGAFAPLTASGSLLVENVLCSCYAPPSALSASHDACHAAMLPLRLAAMAAAAVERLTRQPGTLEPVASLEVKWFRAPYSAGDESIHPYAAGLLGLVLWWNDEVKNRKTVDFRSCPTPTLVDVFGR